MPFQSLPVDVIAPLAFWQGFTRLGEAQILLPVVLAICAWLWWREPASREGTAWWLTCVAVAATLTTVTKVAFIGFGVGSAAWDFTGVSGHAMFAAATLPVLGRLLVLHRGLPWHRIAVGLGYALAALVAVSRVMVQAHSTSEAVSGFVCGALASAVALLLGRHHRSAAVPLPLMLAVPLVIVLGMGSAPPSRTHDWVTSLSLTISGRAEPCTREQFHASGCALGPATPSTPGPA